MNSNRKLRAPRRRGADFRRVIARHYLGEGGDRAREVAIIICRIAADSFVFHVCFLSIFIFYFFYFFIFLFFLQICKLQLRIFPKNIFCQANIFLYFEKKIFFYFLKNNFWEKVQLNKKNIIFFSFFSFFLFFIFFIFLRKKQSFGVNFLIF